MSAVSNGSVDPTAPVAGCACWAGATARLTTAPDGSTTVICQDGRLSFLNPGDREDDGVETLPDPCAGFSCGDNGQCISMNLTPTCVCDQGYVAVGQIDSDGARKMNCVKPTQAVDAAFYANTLPALPKELPGGREVKLTEPEPMPMPGNTTLETSTPPLNFPMPRSNPELGPSQIPVGAPCCKENAKSGGGGGGCNFATPAASSAAWGWLAALGLAASWRRRRSR
jgi:MYXO-CTERM domain-containing protein